MTEKIQEAWNYIKEHEGKGTCHYLVMHEDGNIGLCALQACWFYVWKGMSERNTRQGDNLEDQFSKNQMGYPSSAADIESLRISLVPHHNYQAPKMRLLRAYRALMSIYRGAIIQPPVKNLWSEGFTLKVKHGGLTREQLGTFLISFRNLAEKKRWPFFLRLLDAGFTPSVAAAWMNIFEATTDKGDELRQALTYHTILQDNVCNIGLCQWLAFTKDNAFFYVKEGQTVEPVTGAIDWALSSKIEKLIHANRGDEYLIPQFEPAVATRKDQWGSPIYTYNTDKVIEIIKEFYNEQ